MQSRRVSWRPANVAGWQGNVKAHPVRARQQVAVSAGVRFGPTKTRPPEDVRGRVWGAIAWWPRYLARWISGSTKAGGDSIGRNWGSGRSPGGCTSLVQQQEAERSATAEAPRAMKMRIMEGVRFCAGRQSMAMAGPCRFVPPGRVARPADLTGRAGSLLAGGDGRLDGRLTRSRAAGGSGERSGGGYGNDGDFDEFHFDLNWNLGCCPPRWLREDPGSLTVGFGAASENTGGIRRAVKMIPFDCRGISVDVWRDSVQRPAQGLHTTTRPIHS